MSPMPSITEVRIESQVFPPAVKPPGTSEEFFLGGAGERGMVIEGNFITFTAIGVYLQHSAIPSLAAKWEGKIADELAGSVEFFRDIVTGNSFVLAGQKFTNIFNSAMNYIRAMKEQQKLTASIGKLKFLGPFEKFTQVTMIKPLSGKMYSEKVSENCVAYWKAVGTYTDAEAKAIEKFMEAFKDEMFPPGSCILFNQSPLGSLTITFSKDGSIPETGKFVIENKQLSEAVLESIIGEHGVSPAARKSLATRMSELLKDCEEKEAQKPDAGELPA